MPGSWSVPSMVYVFPAPSSTQHIVHSIRNYNTNIHVIISLPNFESCDIYCIRPKKSCLFPVTLPLQVFIRKKPYPKVFIGYPTPNQHKTCIKHTFLTKRNNAKKFFLLTYLPYCFFGPLQETNNFFF